MPTGSYNVIAEQTTDLDNPAAAVEFAAQFAAVGATWCLDADWADESGGKVSTLPRRIEAGPPRQPPRSASVSS